MRLVTKVLITVGLAFAASWLLGCQKAKPASDYGQYNIGVCGVGEDEGAFLASTVDAEADSFTILAVADSLDSVVDQRQHPLVFKYSGDIDGFRAYKRQINGHEDEVLIKLQNGTLTGVFKTTSGQLLSNLHGLKGTIQTLGQDGLREDQICNASRQAAK